MASKICVLLTICFFYGSQLFAQNMNQLRIHTSSGSSHQTVPFDLNSLGFKGSIMQKVLNHVEKQPGFYQGFFSIRSVKIQPMPANIHIQIPTRLPEGRLTIYLLYGEGTLRYIELAAQGVQFGSNQMIVEGDLTIDPSWRDPVIMITEEKLTSQDPENVNVQLLLTQVGERTAFNEDDVVPDNLFNPKKLIFQLLYSDGSKHERTTLQMAQRLLNPQHATMIYLQ